VPQLLAALFALAVFPPATEGQETLPAPHLDTRQLEPFFDQFFAQEMRTFQARGAVVAVVHGGQTVFAKGYGCEDDAGTPVTPERTLFRVGSVSKVVTAMAVMQQVECGRLDLYRNVNDYLAGSRVRVDEARGAVTLHHLLTHTAGFDEQHIGLFPTGPEQVLPLELALARRPHRLVHTPGEFYVYSKWGMDLAGYLVEARTGEPFARYAEERILRPLGMDRSTFDPLPDPGAGVATGYYHRHGVRAPVPFPYLGDTPGDGLKATAADMARLIAAHLPGGCASRVMRPETIRLMHERQFGYHPLATGATYGFREHLTGGPRALVHPGYMPGFVSLVCLIPECDLGFFAACNNSHPQETMNASLLQAFFTRFFPVRPPTASPAPGADELDRLVGEYRPINYSHGSFEKLASIMQHMTVRVGEGGVVLIGGKPWARVAPGLLYGDGEYATFREGPDGVTHLMIGLDAFEKLPVYERLPVQVGLAGGFALVFLSGCIFWAMALLARGLGASRPAGARLPLAAPVLGLLTAALNLGFLAGIARAVAQSDYYDFLYGMPRTIVVLLTVPLATAVMAVALVILATRCWTKRRGTLVGRLSLSVAAAAAAGFIPFLRYWNLLGFCY
jgi:CubicO group peptidase (beta-lactamase class C family)